MRYNGDEGTREEEEVGGREGMRDRKKGEDEKS